MPVRTSARPDEGHDKTQGKAGRLGGRIEESWLGIEAPFVERLTLAASAKRPPDQSVRGFAMNISVSLGPLAALIAGILILIVPRLLNYIVALYLIIIGLLGLFGPASQHLRF